MNALPTAECLPVPPSAYRRIEPELSPLPTFTLDRMDLDAILQEDDDDILAPIQPPRFTAAAPRPPPPPAAAAATDDFSLEDILAEHDSDEDKCVA